MASFSLAACALLAFQTPAPEPAAKSAPPLFSRIAVIGASASAGYSLHVSLADALDAQIAIAHETPKLFAEEAMFLQPAGIGEKQVELAAAVEPTLVVAADFLFWFGYGEVVSEAERLENLELGLELLDKLKCPLIVSHLPDMTPAVGKMLLASQVPSPETLVKLNARVDEWATARGRVAFAALPEMLEKLRSGTKWSIGGTEFAPPYAKPRLLQRDELHPTVGGLAVLARLCLDGASAPAVGANAADIRAELEPAWATLRKLEESRAGAPAGTEGKPAPAKPKSGGREFELAARR